MQDAWRFFESLEFRHEWRKYQRLILELFEQRDLAKRTFHVVAPPGSGKTLVGIEIARRIGRPAVTFSPTTTIQEQWRDKVRLFLPESPSTEALSATRTMADALADVSTDPERLGAISNLTYQSLSTQTQEREFLDRLGRAAWVRELVREGGREEPGAEAYVADIERRSQSTFRTEVARRAIREKRRLLSGGEASVHEFLHPNALDLIERIIAAGTGCVILDEAHHLLDYWALILEDLIRRLPDVLVVGLTATPPASADPEELANYLRLVNGIDFEVPTPAVVRDGYLAPYQDLVMLTRPTNRERAFLERQDELLQAAIERMRTDPRFGAWLSDRINRPTGRPSWDEVVRDSFEFAVAGARLMLRDGQPLADDIELLDALRQPPTLDDQLAILRVWCLEVLRLSDSAADAEALGDLRAVLRTLGLVMTDSGWRSAPSPIERVLAYSESKVEGLVEILGLEAASMGDLLRAVVVTDHERAPALATQRWTDVLDDESGGAVRAFRALVKDPATVHLTPIMVTGRTVLVPETFADGFLAAATAYFFERALPVQLSKEIIELGVAEIDGAGSAWRPRHYVALATDLLDRGVTRCIVGTRGLLAEGWDSLVANTLIDLTTAGTFASVNQLRGRTIRLDARDPMKVANNWDVVCYEPKLEEGDRDLRRLISKHGHTWGIGSGDRIIRGVGHVDERIPFLGAPVLLTATQVAPSPEDVNRTSRRRARDRLGAYRRWNVGAEYDNFAFTGTVLERPEAPLRTSFTWGRSLRALLNLILGWIFVYFIVLTQNGLRPALALPAPWSWVAIAGIIVAPILLTLPLIRKYVRSAFIDLPVDSHLADFGKAVTEAYRTSGLAPMSTDQVRVRVNPSHTYDVVLDSRDRAMVDAFAASYRELFEPIFDQRYLVTRDEADISGTFYAPIWWALRRLFRTAGQKPVAYHPVPTAFSRNRELADQFAGAWKRWVGGGSLVYTRSPTGMEVLLRERMSGRRTPRAAAVHEWT